mgnify:FL=1
MKAGDKVQYREGKFINLVGEIRAIQGRKWIKVQWSDNVVLVEHINDLNFLSKTS